MPESLLVWFNLFTDDPGLVRGRLNGRPVLLYEPPIEDEPDDEEDEDFRLRTQSGIVMPAIGGGEPLAVVIEKTKDNAFQRRITVGRTANNDIVLDDQSVSRFHAYLQQDERSEWTITDAGSRNGSFVSGRRLPSKTPVPLSNACVLRIGAVQLTFYSAQGFMDLLKRRAHG
ncbi:MAG: FHA domain-containing protein [Myxococcota bacterium]|jgi:pSer/pThr/pTyr-binding forkhead associated (FHA) protein